MGASPTYHAFMFKFASCGHPATLLSLEKMADRARPPTTLRRFRRLLLRKVRVPFCCFVRESQAVHFDILTANFEPTPMSSPVEALQHRVHGRIDLRLIPYRCYHILYEIEIVALLQ